MAACPTAAAQCDTPTHRHACVRIDTQVALDGQIIKGDLLQLGGLC